MVIFILGQNMCAENTSEQTTPKVAFMGPPGSFSHSAGTVHFGHKTDFFPLESIEEVFLKVFKDEADYGVVLLENAFGEAARRTLDLFVDFGLKVKAEIIISPTLHLLTRTPRTRIKRIYATPDVISLCRVLLERDMREKEVQRVLTTSVAAGLAADGQGPSVHVPARRRAAGPLHCRHRTAADPRTAAA